jgi:hypothetical protein
VRPGAWCEIGRYASISILRAFTISSLGMCTSRTPVLKIAFAFSTSASAGSVKDRSKCFSSRSWRWNV